MTVSGSPVFSVILPTHNRADKLPRAIRSVLAQTYRDFELLVIDDGSEDNTPEVMKSFSGDNVIYHRIESNGGAAAARNAGILRARGRYVSFLDDDDEYLPNFLLLTMQAFEDADPEVGMTWCGINRIRETPAGHVTVSAGVWSPTFHSREDAYLSFIRSRRIGTNAGITIRRSCFETVGLFDERLRKAEDTEFLIRFVRRYDFVVIPELLVNVYLHGGDRLTTYDQRMADAYEVIIAKNRSALDSHPSLAADLHYKTGWLFYHGGDHRNARRHMVQALRHRSFHRKTWLAMALFEVLREAAPPVHRRLSLWSKSRQGGDFS